MKIDHKSCEIKINKVYEEKEMNIEQEAERSSETELEEVITNLNRLKILIKSFQMRIKMKPKPEKTHFKYDQDLRSQFKKKKKE